MGIHALFYQSAVVRFHPTSATMQVENLLPTQFHLSIENRAAKAIVFVSSAIRMELRIVESLQMDLAAMYAREAIVLVLNADVDTAPLLGGDALQSFVRGYLRSFHLSMESEQMSCHRWTHRLFLDKVAAMASHEANTCLSQCVKEEVKSMTRAIDAWLSIPHFKRTLFSGDVVWLEFKGDIVE